MPIAVACPCGANVKAPGSAAGRRIRCQECDRILAVPTTAAESVAESRAGDKGRSKSHNLLLIGVLCGVALVMLAAWWGFAWWYESHVNSQTNGQPSSATTPTRNWPNRTKEPGLPHGWARFQGEGFSVAVPDSVRFEKPSTPQTGGISGKKINSWQSETPTTPGPLGYCVSIDDMTPEIKQAVARNKDDLGRIVKLGMEINGSAMKVESDKPIPFEGGAATQLTCRLPEYRVYMRMVCHGDKVYTLVVLGLTLPDDTDPTVATFFDSFRVEGAKPIDGTKPLPTPPAVLPDGWKKFDGDGFSVGVPDGVGLTAGEKTTAGGQKMKTWSSELNPDTTYLLMKTQVPTADIAKFQRNRAITWEGIVSSVEKGASPHKRAGPAQELTTADGLDGRLFTLKHGEGQMRCAICVDERGAIYHMMVVQPSGAKPEDSRAKTFFDSFRIEEAK